MASRTGWLKRAWAALRPTRSQRQYAVACRCGQTVRGPRQTTHQVVRCPQCNGEVFILPLGAFHPPTRQPKPATPQPRSGWWLIGLTLLGGSLILLALVFVLVHLLRPAPVLPPAPVPPTERSKILALLEQGSRELDQGAPLLARKTLDQAVTRRDGEPSALEEAEHRRLNQLQRQAALLVERIPVSLSALLDEAERAPDWPERFTRNYRDRGVILDDVFRTERDRRIMTLKHSDLRGTGPATGRVAVEDLALVQQLPLQVPQRWILGARLKSFSREGGPGWVIRLVPESGVLFSNRPSLEAEVAGLSEDPVWPKVLSRQQELLDSLPAPRAHR